MQEGQKITDGSGQKLLEGQTLGEKWEIEYEGGRRGGPIKAVLTNWPNSTRYVAWGHGETVEEARLDLVSKLARAIHEDPNPFGDLGNVAHIANVVRFLEALRKGEHNPDPYDPEDRYSPPSDYYLPDQLSDSDRALLPDTHWEDVIGHVIDMVKSWADYYPEEGDISTPGEIEKEPEIAPLDDDDETSPFNRS